MTTATLILDLNTLNNHVDLQYGIYQDRKLVDIDKVILHERYASLVLMDYISIILAIHYKESVLQTLAHIKAQHPVMDSIAIGAYVDGKAYKPLVFGDYAQVKQWYAAFEWGGTHRWIRRK